MNIRALFPFGIRAGSDGVGADAVTVLTAGIHLDRRAARAIGWRGLRPAMGAGQAWTMRLARHPGVYGLAYLGEERRAGIVHSRFSVFYFPDPGEPLLATYMPDARRAAADTEYFAKIREFPAWERGGLFFLGLLRLAVAPGGEADTAGICFSLESPLRQRIVALDGLAEEGVEPGAPSCDIPAFRLGGPFLRLLVLSASSLLESPPEWAFRRTSYPAPAFTAQGEWGALEGAALPGVVLAARFGRISHPDPANAGVQRLSGRAFAFKPPPPAEDRPVLHTISGFLGSGKTTFLAEWLAWLHNHDRHTAVLQNELGAKSLDSVLLEHETVSETLDAGCVCCTLADSLRPAIRRLTEKLPAAQIILETTGVANPAAVADALENLGDMVRPGLRITLADASLVESLLPGDSAEHPELAGEQIRRADVLVCNKADAVSESRLARIVASLKAMNPGAAVFTASFGRIPFGELDILHERTEGPGAKAAAAFRPRPSRFVTHRDEGYDALAFPLTRPVREETIAAVVRFAGEKAFRIKGVVESAEENRPVVVQYVAGTLALERPLSPPGPDRFLVFIGKGIDAAFAASLEEFLS